MLSVNSRGTSKRQQQRYVNNGGVYICSGNVIDPSAAMNPEARPSESEPCVVNGSTCDEQHVQTINIFADSQNEDIVQLKMKNKLCAADVGVVEPSCKDLGQIESLSWLKPTLESSHSLPNLSIESEASGHTDTSSVSEKTARSSCTDITSKQGGVCTLEGADSCSTSSSTIQYLVVEKNGIKLRSHESDLGTDTENEELQNLLANDSKSPSLIKKGNRNTFAEDNITICVNNNNNRLSKVLEYIPLLYIPHTKQLVSVKQPESQLHPQMENIDFSVQNSQRKSDQTDHSCTQSPQLTGVLRAIDQRASDCTLMGFSGTLSDTASISSNTEILSQDHARERTLSNPESEYSSGSTGNVLSQDSDVSCTSASTVTNGGDGGRLESQAGRPLNVDNFDVISVDSFSKMSIDRESPHGSLNRNNTAGSFSKNLTDASSFSSVSSISTNTDFSMSATSCSDDYVDLKGFIMDTDDAGFMEVNLHSRNSFERSRNSSQDSGIDEKHGHGAKPKRRTISGFFSRNLFSKKPKEPSDCNSAPGWKLFGRIPPKEISAKDASLISSEYQAKSQHVGDSSVCVDEGRRRHHGKKHQDVEVTSTTGLILETRPQGLPSKTPEEEERHRQEYEAMIEAAKKREMKEARLKRKHQQQQIRHESLLAATIQIWNHEILPNWENMKNSKKARELWWMGVPPSVRGRVWQLAIGNELNLTSELYEICLTRAKDRIKMMLETVDTEDTDPSPNREASVDLIKLDVSRTFPQLCIFQKGGPYHDFLQSLLGAYACYRPDVGYVQGMSFIAAFLLLNMDVDQAFICFANLLNKPCQVAFFRMDEGLIKSYFSTYEEFLKENLPRLYEHFDAQGLTPDLYIIDWMFTLFSKSLPLDVACRVWDVFCRDGEEFLFRTALGILKLYEEILLHMDFIHLAQYLTKLPESICAEQLFRCIDTIRMAIDKRRFVHVLSDNKDGSKCDT